MTTDVRALDLQMQMSADDYTPQVGQEVTWTITIVNDSSELGENVVVEDMLPEGMTFVSANFDTGAYANGVWSLGDLAADTEATATVTMIVMDDPDQYITNFATVSSDSHDCNPWNDSSPMSVMPWQPTAADLSLVKTVSDPQPEVGDSVDWTVTVTNSGPETAWNTVIEETLPAGVTFAGASATSGSYDFATGVWSVGHLEDGASAEIVISTTIDTDAAATYVNTAVASSSTVDSDESNNTAEASITVAESADESEGAGDAPEAPKDDMGQGMGSDMGSDMDHDMRSGMRPDKGDGADDDKDHECEACAVACCFSCDQQEETGADLQIVKLVDNATPDLNSSVVWSMLVTNNGPEDAENVVVNDNLPAGVEYVSDSASMGVFDPASGTWEIGDLANGESVLLQITTIATDAVAVQTNIALVSSDTEDSNSENNVAIASIDAVDADLAIVKTVDNETPDLGADVVWTIELTNNGPDEATGIEILDVLPEGVTFVPEGDGNVLSAGTFDPATGSWTLDSLAVGATETIALTTTVTSLDEQLNTADVTSETPDSNPDNNSDDATTDAIAADLQITKVVSDEAPNIGDTITWTIELTNNGPDAASEIEVTEILPAGVTLIPLEVGSPSTAGTFVDGVWTLDTLAVGATETLTLSTEVISLDIQANTASVTSATVDTDPTNDADTAETDPVAADLAITKAVSEESPSLGESVTWTVVVTNNGPDGATEVVVLDTLPTGVVYESATTATGVVTVAADGSIDWQIGELASGASVTLEIATEVTSLDIQENVATVTAAPGEDQDDSNNTAVAEADAIQVDLSVTNVVDTEVASVGDTVVWTVTVTNDGPDDATGVALSDVLPEGIEFVSADSANYAEGVLEVGDLASGETVTVNITSTVGEDATAGELISIAEVISQEEPDLDSTPDNDDGDQSEDDEAAASITIEPAFGAVANNLEVDGSGAGSINAVVVIDRSSSMKEQITIDGVTKTRLDWNIEAVEEFATRTEVQSIKVIAFDARVTDSDGEEIPEVVIYDGGGDRGDDNHIPDDEVSDWIDLSTDAGTDTLAAFLAQLGPWGAGTNYQAAIDATMAQDLNSPVDALETNYYFFSDGKPTEGGDAENTLLDVPEWEAFAEANFDNTYAVGFAGAIDERDALEEIAHVNGESDDPTIDDDPNVLLVDEIDAVPSVLSNFASTSVSGNAIADDISETSISITSMVFDGVTYTYDGSEISETGTTQDAFLTNSFVVVDSVKEGSLQFDFETGDFTYFSPTTTVDITEEFTYTIVDEGGMTSSADVTINVAAYPAATAATETFELAFTDLISANDDDLDQILPASPAVARLPSVDGELSVVEGHGGSDIHLPQLDLEMQIWDSGIAMF